MHIQNLTRLSVIEMPYGDLNWGPDPKHIRAGIYSDIQLWDKYRELDDYHLCGIYNKAGVPVQTQRITYQPNEKEEIYLTLTRQLSDAVYQSLSSGSALLLTGGYCKDAVAVCGGIQRYLGTDKRVGIIYLDAHSDMSTPEVTTTGILGGMDVAAILGKTLPTWCNVAGLSTPYSDELVLLSDFRESAVNDDGALPLVQSSKLCWLKTNEFNDPHKWRESVFALANKVAALYLHIDGDILARPYAPNAACVADGGPSIFTVMDNIRTVMQTGKVLVYGSYGFYFDTDISGQDSLTLSGLRTVSAGLDAWKQMPVL